MKPNRFSYWLAGIRLYIAIGIGLATIEVWWWARTAYGVSDLATIRLQETYAWAALLLLFAALVIGPLYKLLPALPGKVMARDARRLLGVGAAWFASLHTAITYFGLFHATNPQDLSSQYTRPFALGLGALLILLAMAFTSFDAAFRGMGVWWFRLHRLVYAALALIIIHILMIGVHGTQIGVLSVLTLGCLTILSLHIGVLVQQNRRPSLWQLATITLAVMSFVVIGNYALQQYISSHDITGGAHNHGPR